MAKYIDLLFARFARKKEEMWFIFAGKARKNEPLSPLLARAKRVREGSVFFVMYLDLFVIFIFQNAFLEYLK